MKRIVLFRHGKSDWNEGYSEDHERPLAERGIAAAGLMGRYLEGLSQAPDFILSSSAVRARETARLALEAGNWSCPLETTDALYAASPEDVLEEIQLQDDVHDSLLLVGHEPTWSLLAGALAGGAAISMPTATMARVDLEADRWSEVRFGRGELIWIVRPKQLSRLGF